VRLTSAEIERALHLSDACRNALNKHSTHEPGWMIRTSGEVTQQLMEFCYKPAFPGVWLPVSPEVIALSAIKARHEGSAHPAEWSATIDICSLPMFSPSGVSCGVRWMVGGSRAKARVSGEGESPRLAALNFLAAYMGGEL
jgi:hypothetical protein